MKKVVNNVVILQFGWVQLIFFENFFSKDDLIGIFIVEIDNQK